MEFPEYFHDLSYAEIALCSRIQPVICVSYLKSGSRVSKGHVSFIDRTKTITALNNSFPCLVEDLLIITLQRETLSTVDGKKNCCLHPIEKQSAENNILHVIFKYPKKYLIEKT